MPHIWLNRMRFGLSLGRPESRATKSSGAIRTSASPVRRPPQPAPGKSPMSVAPSVVPTTGQPGPAPAPGPQPAPQTAGQQPAGRPTAGQRTTEHLKTNALGARSITFLVVAAAAPLTVMAGVAPLAILVGGIGAPAGYLAAGAVLALFAVGFMAMTRHTGGAGAFYSYITLGLGRTMGMSSGVLAVVAYNALQIGVYGLLGQQVSDAVATLAGIQLPWWLF